MSGRIPEAFIDDLLARTDIVDVIDGRVPLKKAGREFKACCPFHEEKTPSFTVSPDKQFYHCFGCGAHGTSIGFLMAFENLDFVGALEQLAARLGLEVPREGRDRGDEGKASDILSVLEQSNAYFRRQLRHHPGAAAATGYLKKRGLTGEIAARYKLGYAPPGWDNLYRELGVEKNGAELLLGAGLITRKSENRYYDRFRNRIMFPIHNQRGQVVGFGGRAIGDDQPKYLNSPETPVFHKGAELYGLYLARGPIKEAGKGLVVEGYMDVVALSQFGVDYAVATLGTATTPAQLERLFRHTDEIVFCFDGDRAGRDAAWRALENTLPAMREGRQVSFLFLPQGEDPDSMVRAEGRAGFEARIAAALPLPDYLIQHLSERCDLERMDGRARFIELARPMLRKISGGVFRDLLLDQLARTAGVDRNTVERAVPASAPPRPGGPRPAPARKSLVRDALSLLIQRPQLADCAGELDDLDHLDLPGITLLLDAVRTVRRNPGLNTASLLERYRGSEHHQHLEKLAARDHMVAQEAQDRQFEAIFEQFRERWAAQQAKQLLHKSHLSSSEKARLRELLSRRVK